MADGPMSTPLRSWPRSMGTPKIPTGRRVPSDKRHAPRSPGIGGGLEGSLRGAPHRVYPAEVHRGLLVDEHLPVAVEPARTGAGLVGEEVALGMEARGEDRRLQRHTEVKDVNQRLQYGRGYAGGAWRPQSYQPPLLGGNYRRAHARDQTLPRRQRVEAFGVELWLAQGVVHRDARARYHEP